MLTCVSCGHDNPAGSRFCNGCGRALDAMVEESERSTERKVVSVLFCDLVGFTSRSESADPEDVLATVRPYHQMLRADVENYGGTVEKFIGDAVMAVYGAPISHEDDAERAIRSALRILESIEERNEKEGTDLAVRIGINTGEAVVSLGARPELGEGIVTGDVVNTAARLQTGAPVGGIAVGRATYLATEEVFDFEELDPIVAKGKSEPVPAWRVWRARARFGTEITRAPATPLVGREVERALLRGLFERALRDRSCQLVTIGGEPGVGKSRLVHDLSEYIEERDDFVVWRQGRCLPYGEGITFWALGEIVKAEAGILETDSPDEAADKLGRALRTHAFEREDAEWLHARLAPLVGADGAGSTEREESFTAWRRFLEGLASAEPAVFVFEDLHWADPAMLEFIEHLADWVEDTAMVLVCTARPEFSAKHPAWGGGVRNATSLNLPPLSSGETAQLMAELLDQAVLPSEVQTAILERAGGNPLYAEEFVRMLKGRGVITKRGRTWVLAEGAEIPLPGSLHGLISSRLDALDADRKSVLQDAAVIGKVFWSGALVAMSDVDEHELDDALHELTKKEFVRRVREPAMEGEREYTFTHMLVRDVAYAQIPRAARGRKHVAVAEWVRSRAGDRAEDLADMLAYHYVEALELARSAGAAPSEGIHDLIDESLRALMLAADRAADLDPARAEALCERALELVPSDHPMRADILVGLAEVRMSMGRFVGAYTLLEDAVGRYDRTGDRIRAARAKVRLALAKHEAKPSPHDLEILMEGIGVLEETPPNEDLAAAYAYRANWEYLVGQDSAATEWASKALALGANLGLPVDPFAARVRGGARCFTGDIGGMDDIQDAIASGRARGMIRQVALSHNELANVLALTRGSREALGELERGIEVAKRSGLPTVADELECVTGFELYFALGEWDRLLESTSAVLRSDRDDLDVSTVLAARIRTGMVATWRDDLGSASKVTDDLEATIRTNQEPQYLIGGFDVLAHLAIAKGEPDRAAAFLRELEAYPHIREGWNYASFVPELVRLAIAAADPGLAEALLTGVPDSSAALRQASLEMGRAQLSEARPDPELAAALYASAEEGLRAFSLPERAQALLGQGRCLLVLGDPLAQPTLREARSAFAELDARRFLPEVDRSLERAVAITS